MVVKHHHQKLDTINDILEAQSNFLKEYYTVHEARSLAKKSAFS